MSYRNGDENEIGGLVGRNNGSVENSFALTSVANGKEDQLASAGGLVGLNDPNGRVLASYAAGEITNQSKIDNNNIGGLIGSDDAMAGAITDTYWDLDRGISDRSQGAGNIPNDPGITGLTEAQLKSGLPAGFDPTIWGSDSDINNGYPYLLDNPPK